MSDLPVIVRRRPPARHRLALAIFSYIVPGAVLLPVIVRRSPSSPTLLEKERCLLSKAFSKGLRSGSMGSIKVGGEERW